MATHSHIHCVWFQEPGPSFSPEESPCRAELSESPALMPDAAVLLALAHTDSLVRSLVAAQRTKDVKDQDVHFLTAARTKPLECEVS
ncbi:hypothetical protein RRG08_044381 [Elysia crispata]|uniref:Uncharacterized protein n=1 Tax=Elysia crispata TaxID=231223 RepID=A0AAE0YNH2_9GAST|nr:hypothetical protein RRG08_044381 [Elysia crispata]